MTLISRTNNPIYSYSLWVCLFFGIVALRVGHDLERWKKDYIIRWDASGYYTYLPALLIYHDFQHARFLPEISQKYRPADNEFFYAMHPTPKGKVVNKYTMGVASLELPFFLVAHAYASNSSRYPPDGWSLPYQVAVLLCAICYGFLGLYYLRKTLLLLLPENISALTLASIAFGTNFFFYVVVEGGLSHVYLFCSCAIMLYHTIQWHENGHRLRNLLGVSIAIAWAVTCRPTEIIVIIIPLLYGIVQPSDVRKQIQTFWQYKRQLLIGLSVGALILFPQLLYWKIVTGSWIFYSYVGEGFDFLHPHILDGLFSYRKGWFLYTPLALFIPISIILLWFNKNNRKWFLNSIVFFTIYVYVTFSWTTWAYGGSFGARPMVQALPIFSIALGFLLKTLFDSTKYLWRLTIVLFVSCIALNLFQTHQYQKGVLVWDNMNKAYYWRVFGKTEVTEEDRKLLGWW